jgi:capsular polysaccharide biosynthesis protein
MLSDPSSVDADDDEELDLGNLIRLIWRNKLLIGLIAILCGGIEAAIAFTTPPIFRATAVVVPVHEKDLSSGGIANQIGALTSLVGVNLGQTGSEGPASDAVLDSRWLVEEFVKRNNLLPVLGVGSKKPLTLWLGVKKFKEGLLTIRKDTRRGTTTVAVDWYDAAVAARWANGLIALTNELIRTRAIDVATRNIAYLNRELEQTTAVELRQALYDIIKNETKTLMLANGRDDYAFEIVDPAVPSEWKERPHRALLTLVGLSIGAFLGTVVAFIRERVRRRKSPRPAR